VFPPLFCLFPGGSKAVEELLSWWNERREPELNLSMYKSPHLILTKRG
jgi:hypothetical protein